MNFFIVLFIAALLGIFFMLGRKMRNLSNGLDFAPPMHFKPPTLEDLRLRTAKMAKMLGYFLLVESIRVYVRLSEATKKDWAKLKAAVKARLEQRNSSQNSGTPANKFLRAAAEYKRRIGKIKRAVKEEENL